MEDPVDDDDDDLAAATGMILACLITLAGALASAVIYLYWHPIWSLIL